MKVIAENRKARFNYFIIDEVEAGIELQGSEVKSIRCGHISLAESFVHIQNGEVFLKNAYIKPYEMSGSFTPDERRNRKLLLHKNEIARLQKNIEAQGYTLVPLKAYFKRDKVKILVGVGKGKKLYDKRETQKKQTINKEIARYLNK